MDAGGLNLSVSSDRNITVGTINVGYDNVSLTARNGSLQGWRCQHQDRRRITDLDRRITAIGADGAGNAIDTRVSIVDRPCSLAAAPTSRWKHRMPSLIAGGRQRGQQYRWRHRAGLGQHQRQRLHGQQHRRLGSLAASIVNATTVNLTANGLIGNKSAIRTTESHGRHNDRQPERQEDGHGRTARHRAD